MAVCKGSKTFQSGNKKNNLKLKRQKNDILITGGLKNRYVERRLGRSVANRYEKWKEKKEKVI
jgi:hypothetical protein